MYYSTTYDSPICPITLASDGNNLVGLWMKEQKYFGEVIPTEMITKDDLEIFNKTKRWLDLYFEGKNPSILELPLAPIGGDFRQDVWKILCEIPYGEIILYGDIAKKIAKKRNKKAMSAQAIGGAVGHNPIAIIIPCHRVVGTNKNLIGFSGGIAKKKWLLEHEGIDVSKLIYH